MVLEKKKLSFEEIEAQSTLKLPAREMLALVNVFITNVANNLTVSIPVQNNNLAVQVCAVVSAINTILIAPDHLTCSIVQR